MPQPRCRLSFKRLWRCLCLAVFSRCRFCTPSPVTGLHPLESSYAGHAADKRHAHMSCDRQDSFAVPILIVSVVQQTNSGLGRDSAQPRAAADCLSASHCRSPAHLVCSNPLKCRWSQPPALWRGHVPTTPPASSGLVTHCHPSP